MHGVILAGFYFNWHHGKAVVVVDEIIHLAFAAIIVIVKGMAVADELACNHRFIDTAEINAFFIVQNSANIVAVENIG